MLDLTELANAMAPLAKVWSAETVVEIQGHRIALRTLVPSEEIAVQKYAALIVEENADSKGQIAREVVTEYYARLRSEVLSYSIVAIDDLDLREHEFVQTSPKTATNPGTFVARHIAVRDLITKSAAWSGSLLQLTYDAYTQMQAQVTKDTADLVQTEPADLDVEITRLKDMLNDLERERELRAKGDPNIPSSALSEFQPPPPPVPKPAQEPVPNPVQSSVPNPVPPAPHEPEIEKPVRSAIAGQMRQPALPEWSSPPGQHGPAPVAPPLFENSGSFADPEEEGVLDAEYARITEARRRLQEERQAVLQNQASAVRSAGPPSRVPPHLRGRAVEDPTEVGYIDGAPVFRSPTQELTARGAPTPTSLNPDPEPSGVVFNNPNFVPVRR